MTPRQRRYSRDEFARRGHEIYDRVVRPIVRPEDANKFVAIDIESADFEIDANDCAASERLRNRHPEAQIWRMRAGGATSRPLRLP